MQNFVIFTDINGELNAVWPFVFTDLEKKFNQCYAHVGQHGSCHPDYVYGDCWVTDPKKYADLLAELKTVGYEDLIVLNDSNIKLIKEKLI